MTITMGVGDPFHYIGGELSNGYLDATRKLLFVSNIGLNEVDVFSTVDDSLKARVPVPQPMEIDQLADGKTLVVGTEAQELVTLDETSDAVTLHPFTVELQGFGTFFPMVVALASGKVLTVAHEPGVDANNVVYGGSVLMEWDPAADTFTQILPSPSAPGGEIDHLTRSADGKWAVFSADQFYLFSSESDSFTAVPLITVETTEDVRGYAVNHDGSKIAVASAYAVNFFDRNFNLLGTAPLPVAFQSARSAIEFSADETKLYLSYAMPLLVEEVDVTSYTALGFLSASVEPDYDNLENMIANDAGGHAYFNIDGGIRVIDSTQAPAPNPTGPGYEVGGCIPALAVVPLNTTQQVSIADFYGVSFYIGGQPAALSSDGSELTVPASGTAGAVDMECIQPDKNVAVAPQAVSYGTVPVGFSASLLPPTGAAQAELYGFGFIPMPYGAAPSVTFNGAASASVTNILNPAVSALEGETVQVPPGTAGTAVSIEVSSSIGSGSMPSAASYYADATILPAAGILQLTFDAKRNRLYALKTNEVDVLDASTLQWLAPLAYPSGFSGKAVSMGITPDGSRLAVYGVGSQEQMLVLDLTGLNPPKVASLPASAYSAPSGSMAMTNQNTVLLAGFAGLAFDLNTLQSSPLGTTTGQVIRASADGSHVYSAALDLTSGQVYSIDPVSYAVNSIEFSDYFYTDLAVSPDGTKFAAVFAPPLSLGDAVSFFNSSLQFTNANVYPNFSPPDDTGVLGATFSPGAKVLVVALGDSIELWDAQTGTLRHRLLTPEELQVLAFPENAVNPLLALNAAGDTIFAVSKSGLSVIQLSAPMDQLPAMQWPNSRASGGFPATLRGTMPIAVGPGADALSKPR